MKKLIKIPIPYKEERFSFGIQLLPVIASFGIENSERSMKILDPLPLLDIIGATSQKKQKQFFSYLERHAMKILKNPHEKNGKSIYFNTEEFLRLLLNGITRYKRRFSKIKNKKSLVNLARIKNKNFLPYYGNLTSYFINGYTHRNYYELLRENIAEVVKTNKYDEELFNKLLAITSVRTRVNSNLTLAKKAYELINSGKKIKGFLPSVNLNIEKLVKTGEINSRKLSNYYQALLGNKEVVVVDTWILRAFRLDRPYSFKGGVYYTMASKAMYDYIELYIKEWARWIGWKPIEVCAALWTGTRRSSGFVDHYYNHKK